MVEAEETTKSGIILTGSAKEKPQVAEVIAVGPGGVVDGKEVKMMSRPATRCSPASTPAPRSRWTARSTSSFVRATFWQSWKTAVSPVISKKFLLLKEAILWLSRLSGEEARKALCGY